MLTPELISEQFISLLKQEAGYELLPEIVELLQKEVERSHTITVISALPLSQTEQSALETMLVQRFGEHTIIMNVDPILLSGMLITYQDQVIDLSGKQALRSLKQELAS